MSFSLCGVVYLELQDPDPYFCERRQRNVTSFLSQIRSSTNHSNLPIKVIPGSDHGFLDGSYWAYVHGKLSEVEDGDEGAVVVAELDLLDPPIEKTPFENTPVVISLSGILHGWHFDVYIQCIVVQVITTFGKWYIG